MSTDVVAAPAEATQDGGVAEGGEQQAAQWVDPFNQDKSAQDAREELSKGAEDAPEKKKKVGIEKLAHDYFDSYEKVLQPQPART